MVSERQPQSISVEEYFELEENTPGICYEYVDGYACMMAGGSFDHDAIKSNIQRIIGNFLLASDGCNVYSSDLRTQVADKSVVAIHRKGRSHAQNAGLSRLAHC